MVNNPQNSLAQLYAALGLTSLLPGQPGNPATPPPGTPQFGTQPQAAPQIAPPRPPSSPQVHQAASTLRAQPPKSAQQPNVQTLPGFPTTTPRPDPLAANPILPPKPPPSPPQGQTSPGGLPSANTGYPDYGAQLQQVLTAQQNLVPPAPMAMPTMQPQNKYFALGEALSALVAPKTLPFVGAGLSYDQTEREKDYERRYNQALENWKDRADAFSLQNQGLAQQAEIIKALSALPVSMAVDRTVPIPKITSKMTPWEQSREMADYYRKIASARLAAGATSAQVKEAADMAAAYDKQQTEDRMMGIEQGKLAAAPGTVLPDGTVVQPGSEAAVLYEKSVLGNQLTTARIAYQKAATANIPKMMAQKAWAIANNASFHAQEIAQRYNINDADRQMRYTIAVLGYQNATGRETQREIWERGKDIYDQQMRAYDAQLQPPTAGGPAPAVPVAPAVPTSTDATVHFDFSGLPRVPSSNPNSGNNNNPPPPHVFTSQDMHQAVTDLVALKTPAAQKKYWDALPDGLKQKLLSQGVGRGL